MRTIPTVSASARLDDAVRAFWDAGSTSDAEKRVAKVVAPRPSFDNVAGVPASVP
jgi:hypothetical protein